MLTNATLTLKDFCFVFQKKKKVKDDGKCHFDLEGTFFNKVKDAGKCNFDLEGNFFSKKVKDVRKCNTDLEGTFFVQQGQGC